MDGVSVQDLIRDAKAVVVLCGAGISVSAGIPDFRSSGGLFEKYGQSIFELSRFRNSPQQFYDFYKEFTVNKYQPTPTHHFIKKLYDDGKLLRCYTQNIDGLELDAGLPSEKLVQVHGHMRTASCINCQYTIPIDEFNSLLSSSNDDTPSKVGVCPKCHGRKDSFIKPDIVFYGENLPPIFKRSVEHDFHWRGFDILGRVKPSFKKSPICDLLIVMGTSLKVAPVNSIPKMSYAPKIYITKNAEPVGEFKYVLDMDCDDFCQSIIY